MKHTGTAVLVATFTFALGALSVGAQEAPADAKAFVIWLVVPSEEIAAVEPLTAYVDGVECGTQTIEKGEPAVVVGGAQTPDACRTDGAPVTLVTSNGLELFTKPAFAGGTGYALENLVPGPPHTGATPETPSPSASGHGPSEQPSRNLAMGFALSAVAIGVVLLGRRLTTAPRRSED